MVAYTLSLLSNMIELTQRLLFKHQTGWIWKNLQNNK